MEHADSFCPAVRKSDPPSRNQPSSFSKNVGVSMYIHVCANVNVCVCTWVPMSMHTHMEARIQHCTFSSTAFHLRFGEGPSLNIELIVSARLPASE